MRVRDRTPARGFRRPIIRRFTALTTALVVAVIVVLLVTDNVHRHDAATSSVPAPETFTPFSHFLRAEVTISSQEPLIAIPHSFLGLSTEYWTLPVDELHVALYRRILTALEVPGDGPLVLRIGGDSSDHTFYDPHFAKLPNWAFDLTPDFVDRTARVVREVRLRVILDLNLITGSARLAGAWAQYAESQMPAGSIIGFEVGNEPDLYDRTFWLQVTEGIRLVGGVFPPDITPHDYANDFEAYAHVLGRVAAHVPLYAPALANPGADKEFISALLATPHPGLRVISGHRYPYSGCTLRDSPQYPTIDRILSEAASAGMAQSVRPAVLLANRAGFPFVLTEFNSITCGGFTGVSNTFATALWAPDAAFELLRAGAQGIHLHARQHAINDPFTFGPLGAHIRPLFYGLLLFARTLGPDARLVPLRLHSDASPHLKAWAVKVGSDTLHILLIDKGRHRLRVTLRIPAAGPAAVQRLLAPSPASHASGVTFGGQWLDYHAQWQGRPIRTVVGERAHEYVVSVPAFSAALVAVHIAHGSLR
jgi:hypothetical protein